MAVFVGALVANCDSGLPRPPYAPQSTAALAQVGLPVPPCQTEIVPSRPRGDAVWLDGEWSWSGSAWSWIHGRWVVAPPGAKFSPWTTARDGQGNVYYASGAWFDDRGKSVPAPPPLAAGKSAMHLITSPDGDDEKTVPSPPVENTTGKTAP